MRRFLTASFAALLLYACASPDRVKAHAGLDGIDIEFEKAADPPQPAIAHLSNGSSSTVCYCVQGTDAEGNPVGDPQKATVDAGKTLDVALPQGATGSVDKVIDCDAEDACEPADDPGHGWAFVPPLVPPHNKTAFVYQAGQHRPINGPVEGLVETVYCQAEISGASEPERFGRFMRLFKGEDLPPGVQIRSHVVLTPVFNTNNDPVGVEVVVTQDEQVSGLAMTVNGNFVQFDQGIPEGGYIKYRAYVPPQYLDLNMTLSTNIFEITHLSLEDGFRVFQCTLDCEWD